MLKLRIGICLAVLGLWTQLAAAEDSHVRARLLADVSAITPGRPFMLGVMLSVDPGWHVYWKNPGDAGLPTRVQFTLPDGFTVGPLLFPTPLRIEQPGNIVVLGYEDSVLLLAQVTPPAKLPDGFTAQFSAEVSWLVCADVCIPGKATANLELGAGPSAAPANADLFDAATAQLPVEAAGSRDIAAIHISHAEAGRVVIQISWKSGVPGDVQFIPATFDDYNITATQVQSEGDQTRITVNFQALAGKKPQPVKAQCVVGYKDNEGHRRGVNVMLALP